ncbi:hypothetical protein PIB30_026492 [Stylosanthes scabra]|uniref:Uncharacterized protein n=1 Tax=Stylosanthes scabra TaxID=79078 RepID=A0ABU6X990_9FABA|nr:hypothetical protein [Stylosanthes scabra]
MARDGGRGRGAATRGRGRPRKNMGIPLNLDPEPRPATSTPTTTTTTTTHTTTPPIVATKTQTSSQPPPTPDTDVADEDAEATASATADTRPDPAPVDHSTQGVQSPIRPQQRKLGRPPTQSEVFVRTHTKKKDQGQYVDTRSEQFVEAVKAEVKCPEDERHARIGVGLPPGPPIDEDEVWDSMASGRKKGRIYGKGKVPKRPAPRLVDPENASTCSGPDAREHITLLNWEIHQQAEQHRREMEYWKQRYETDVTRLQTTNDTQSAEFDQWKSHVSQTYAFMQTMQGTTSGVMLPPPPPPSSSLRPPRPPPAAAPNRTETDPDDGSSSEDEDDYE